MVFKFIERKFFMYDFENRERNKTITIRLSNQELDKLNFMVESSGEKFKSDFIRKLILNEEIKVKENFELKKIDDKLDEILKNQTQEKKLEEDENLKKSLKLIEEKIGRPGTTEDIFKILFQQKDYLEINLEKFNRNK